MVQLRHMPRSPGFEENTDVTICHLIFLKYGRNDTPPFPPPTEGLGLSREQPPCRALRRERKQWTREKTAARPEPRLWSPKREGRGAAPGSRPGLSGCKAPRTSPDRSGLGGGGTAPRWRLRRPVREGARRQVPDGGGSGGSNRPRRRRKAGKSRAESGRAAGSPPAYLEVTGLP